MVRSTPLHREHVAAGARMVEFAGWTMPLHYGSQLAEHHAVRTHAGVFDVSHMTIIDVTGGDAGAFLQRLLAGDVARLGEVGRALYTTLLNEAGGILDDLIVYRLADRYRLVVNAATRAKVLGWLGRPWARSHVEGGDSERGGNHPAKHQSAAKRRFGDLRIMERDLAILAVQGPAALDMLTEVGGLQGVAPPVRFHALLTDGWMIARTGYTGEDGVEILLPNEEAPALWQRLVAAGVQPAGLAARDTLRLEAGLNLYGQDMNEATSPLVSNLGWTVHWSPAERSFVGRCALERERDAGVASKLTGLALQAKGVMRPGQRVRTNAGEGAVTSGLFSPTLGYSIALARLPAAASETVDVLIRGKLRPAHIVRQPFVRPHGAR